MNKRLFYHIDSLITWVKYTLPLCLDGEEPEEGKMI